MHKFQQQPTQQPHHHHQQQQQQQQQPPQPSQQQNGGAGGGGPVIETRWHYLGPDNEAYGPYTAKDMMFWLQSGYFNESFQLRTENETTYHTLGEWTQLLGTHPFGMPVHSLEATVSQMSSMRPQHGPMMMLPPGLQTPFPPPMQMRFPPFLPMPLLHQMGGGGGGPNAPHIGGVLHTQTPSEPIDAGSLSHTPDSEDGLQGHRKPLLHHSAQQHQQLHHQALPLMPQMAAIPPIQHHVEINTDPVTTRDFATQTDPPKVELSKAKAARLLTELFGQMVVIN